MFQDPPRPAWGENGRALGRIATLSLLAVAIGGVVSLAAIGFVEGVAWLNEALLVSPHARIQHEQTPWLVIGATIGVPALGGLLVGLLLRHGAREGRPLGPPDAILAVQTRQPLPSLRGGVVSSLAALLSLGSGASVGQYGPMVYLGAIAGGLAARLKLPVANLQAIAVACGIAAAISTAFNAPIAGLVFAHEVILRHYSMQAFAPTTVASATGYVLANVVFERPPLFLVQFEGVQFGYEFLLFAGEGVLAALVAVAFMRLVLASTAFAQRSRIPGTLRPAAAGLALGIVAVWVPDVLGIGAETLRFATIEGAFTGGELALIVAAKMAVTALCIGFGFAGGVFSPALLIGILFGALFWTGLDALTGLANSGVAVYAICGMMALTSPVIGAPLTTILIVFELTRSYDLTIAAMVAVVFANMTAYRVFGRSLFDVQLAKRGFDLSHGRDRALLNHLLVSESVAADFPSCHQDETVEDVLQRLSAAGRAEAVVVDGQNRYLGMLRVQDARGREQEQVGAAMTPGQVIFDETTTLWQAMRALDGFVGDAAPVVAKTDGRLLGMASEAAVISAYLETVHDLRREENAAA